jgi:hypothetical protein
VKQCRGHGQALLEAAGQLAARLLGEGCEFELPQCPFDALTPPASAQAVSAGEEIQIFHYGKLAVKAEFLGDIADVPAGRSLGVT